jgi:hypothetical protein
MRIPFKPEHVYYLFHDLDRISYNTCAENYSLAKRAGVRGVYAWATGIGIVEVVKDLITNQVFFYGKNRLYLICLNFAGWSSSSWLFYALKTQKITKLLVMLKDVHSFCGYIFETIEDTNNLIFLPLDLALFGQPITIAPFSRFDNLRGYDYEINRWLFRWKK